MGSLIPAGSCPRRWATVCVIATLATSMVQCTEPRTRLDNDSAQAVIVATLSSLTEGEDGLPLLVLPWVGGGDPFQTDVSPFDSVAESYLWQRHGVSADLLRSGLLANEAETRLRGVEGASVHLLSDEEERPFYEPLNAPWDTLRAMYGREATAIRFAQPAISSEGDQALVYFVRSQLFPEGVSVSYVGLVHRGGVWTVNWREVVYVE